MKTKKPAIKKSSVAEQLELINDTLLALINIVKPRDQVAPAPAPESRAALKWSLLGAYDIEWCLRENPLKFASKLHPGVKLLVCQNSWRVLLTDGTSLGICPRPVSLIINEATMSGYKVHTYLTTSYQMGIKIGRP